MADDSKFTTGGLVGIGALVLAGCAVVVAILTFLFGYVTGSEFNPHTFERRRFGFYEIPLVRLQVTPLFRNEASGEVEQLVVAQKYVTPTPGAKEEWHLISFRRSTYEPPPTDVQILARYLDALDAHSSTYWHEWSIRYPDHAAVLWPEVARVARLDQYVLLPPLFEATRNADDDPKIFAAELQKLQSDQLIATADRLEKRRESVDDAKGRTSLDGRIAKLLSAASELQSGDAELKARAEKAAARLPPEPKPAEPPASVDKSGEKKEKSTEVVPEKPAA